MKRAIAAALLVACLPTAFAAAQSAYPPPPYAAPPATASGSYTPQQLDQLLAAVALYPDPLLSDILDAATAPGDIVDADRWVSYGPNAALSDGALEAALQGFPWRPSIKALVSFPQILRQLGAHLDWTEALGRAFLVQQADVTASIQRLRHAAIAAGTLYSNDAQRVIVDGAVIRIEPASPYDVDIPVYNPATVYGPWPHPAALPIYYGPPPGLIFAPVPLGIAFAGGFVVFHGIGHHRSGDRDRHKPPVVFDRDRFDHAALGPPLGARTFPPDRQRPPSAAVPRMDERRVRLAEPLRGGIPPQRAHLPLPGAPVHAGSPMGARVEGHVAPRPAMPPVIEPQSHPRPAFSPVAPRPTTPSAGEARFPMRPAFAHAPPPRSAPRAPHALPPGAAQRPMTPAVAHPPPMPQAAPPVAARRPAPPAAHPDRRPPGMAMRN